MTQEEYNKNFRQVFEEEFKESFNQYTTEEINDIIEKYATIGWMAFSRTLINSKSKIVKE